MLVYFHLLRRRTAVSTSVLRIVVRARFTRRPAEITAKRSTHHLRHVTSDLYVNRDSTGTPNDSESSSATEVGCHDYCEQKAQRQREGGSGDVDEDMMKRLATSAE